MFKVASEHLMKSLQRHNLTKVYILFIYFCSVCVCENSIKIYFRTCGKKKSFNYLSWKGYIKVLMDNLPHKNNICNICNNFGLFRKNYENKNIRTIHVKFVYTFENFLKQKLS